METVHVPPKERQQKKCGESNNRKLFQRDFNFALCVSVGGQKEYCNPERLTYLNSDFYTSSWFSFPSEGFPVGFEKADVKACTLR